MFQALGAAMLKARSPNLSRDRGRNKSRFDADLRTLGRVDSVKTGFSRLEMYDGALLLSERWTSKQILYCIMATNCLFFLPLSYSPPSLAIIPWNFALKLTARKLESWGYPPVKTA